MTLSLISPIVLGTLLSLGLPQEGPDSGSGSAPEPTGPNYEGLAFRSIGPAFMSGRIADIVVHPKKQSTWYVAVGSGGVWKTTNAGTTWTPIFEEEASYSVGCLAIDPSAPSTIWVGTGENVSGRHVGFGDGLYRSTDGGATWEPRGLEKSEHIGSIVIHPDNSDVVVVAAQGPLWSGGGERGVYRTEDGGDTWVRVLGAGEYTGANEVIADPSNPEVLYAALHQRQRTVAALLNGGPESGIHKSTDGGRTWTQLAGGLPTENVAKIGLAVSHFDSDVVFATIEEGDREGGFWRSADGGASWSKESDYLSGGTGPHYYQEIFASPHDPDRVYQMDVRLHVTDDGGKSFHRLQYGAKHSDNHALCFDADDPDYLLVGCDGGIYQTWDHGQTWKFTANLPVTQFYKVALDDSEPFYRVYGGTQDNNTQGGPSRTLNVHGITNADWSVTLFGDGHQPATEPGNPGVVYSEWQEGNLCRFDPTTGEMMYIKPQPAAGEEHDRFNWDSPILVSAHDPARIYFASHRVWRSDNRGDAWKAISGDLTRDIDRFQMPMMGQTWADDAAWDTYAMSRFSTITSLAESPVQDGILWAGTDDGKVQVSADAGGTWRAIDSLPDVPAMYFVNDIKADRFDANTAYVVVDNHKAGDYRPFVLKTTDLGQTWTSMVDGLPERHICWRIVQDHVDPSLLFLGTEFGVFFTNGGEWTKLGGGIPNIPVRDLAIQKRENDLVAATFGRGFYVMDDYSALRGVGGDALTAGPKLFGVRDALWYVQRRPLGAGSPMGRASQGDAYFVAPNPDFGATFTYHLPEALMSSREARRKAATDSGEARYPDFATLDSEEEEVSPAMVLAVFDAAGAKVRELEGPASAGFHRVSWNLRYPTTEAWERSSVADEWDDGSDGGALAAPGDYSVALFTRIDGTLQEVGERQSFTVKPLGGGTLEGASPADVSLFQRDLAALEGDMTAAGASAAELIEKAGAMVSVLRRTPGADASLTESARSLQAKLRGIQHRLSGNPRYDQMNESGPVSVGDRLGYASLGVRFSTYGPTAAHSESVRIAREALAEIKTQLKAIRTADVPRLEAALEAAGAPWTPGR